MRSLEVMVGGVPIFSSCGGYLFYCLASSLGIKLRELSCMVELSAGPARTVLNRISARMQDCAGTRKKNVELSDLNNRNRIHLTLSSNTSVLSH